MRAQVLGLRVHELEHALAREGYSLQRVLLGIASETACEAVLWFLISAPESWFDEEVRP